MSKYIGIDENDFITTIHSAKVTPDLIEVGDSVSFPEDYRKRLKYLDGKIIVVDCSREIKQAELRAQREIECFSYINRGALWYETLTDAQREELRVWYFEWLDVTETLAVPIAPLWLK